MLGLVYVYGRGCVNVFVNVGKCGKELWEELTLKGCQRMTSIVRGSPASGSLNKERKECVTWIYLSGLLRQHWSWPPA